MNVEYYNLHVDMRNSLARIMESIVDDLSYERPSFTESVQEVNKA